jgi:signal transduction histidine kinase
MSAKWTLSGICRQACLLIILCLLPGLVLSEPIRQKSILVLSTEDLTAPFFNKLILSFQSEIDTSLHQDKIIYKENLDFVQFSDKSYQDRLAFWLRDKYRAKKIDVIVAVGYGALSYLLNTNPKIWPNVPVVFVTVPKNLLDKIKLPPNVTGVYAERRLGDLVHMVKMSMPDIKRLALIGNMPARDFYRPFSEAEFDAISGGVKMLDFRGKPIEEVKRLVAHLDPDTAIYYAGLGLTEDGTGRLFAPFAVLNALLSITHNPIFVDNPTSIGTGVVGAMAVDPALRGRQVASFVLQILKGRPVSELPMTTGGVHPMFDWRQLKARGIDTDLLPDNTEILFYQPTLLERYHWQLLATAILVLVLTALVMALLIERRGRMLANQESRKRLSEIAHMNRNAAATIYSAAIAHELNQPLAAIMSNAEAAELFLKMNPPALNSVREILADIRRDDMRASALIHQMRGLLKKSESETALQKLDILEIIRDVRKFLAGEAKLRHVSLEVRLVLSPLWVLGDRILLQQVLINLILNSMDAVSAMPIAKRAIVIWTTLSTENELEISVVDTGTGFGANVGQIFESFFTTKSQGMGMGLSIADAIIQAHGGKISAKNGPGGGAIVSIKLPLLKADSKDAVAAQEPDSDHDGMQGQRFGDPVALPVINANFL